MEIHNLNFHRKSPAEQRDRVYCVRHCKLAQTRVSAQQMNNVTLTKLDLAKHWPLICFDCSAHKKHRISKLWNQCGRASHYDNFLLRPHWCNGFGMDYMLICLFFALLRKAGKSPMVTRDAHLFVLCKSMHCKVVCTTSTLIHLEVLSNHWASQQRPTRMIALQKQKQKLFGKHTTNQETMQI